MDHQQAMNAKLIDRYFLNELSDEDRSGFEEHFFSCSVCAQEVVLAAKFMENARKPLTRAASDPSCLGEETPEPSKVAPSTPRPAVPAAEGRRESNWWNRWLALAPKPALAGACAALLAVVVYQARPEAVRAEITGSYFVAATRASESEIRKIKVFPGQQRVALLFNRTDASLSRLDLVLEAAGDGEIMRFQGDVPKDTDDIQVLVPVAGLASGRYNLRVRNAATMNETATLPFELLFQ